MNDIKEIKKVVAENVKNYRSLHDLSQRALAKKANVDSRMISRIESVDYTFTPSITTLIKIANAFKIPLSKLISNTTHVPVPPRFRTLTSEPMTFPAWQPIRCGRCHGIGEAFIPGGLERDDQKIVVLCPFCNEENVVQYNHPGGVK